MNPEIDEKLSALLDGELSPAEAEALRAEVARSPELAARLAALAAVDDGLRALPGPRVPAELRARVERQLRVERSAHPREPAAARRAPPRAAPRGGAIPDILRSTAVRGRRRWVVAAVAVAAAAALVLLALPPLGREEAPVAKREREALPLVEPAPPAQEPPEAPRAALAEQPPEPAPAPAPTAPAAEEVTLARDLPVIEVLDVLAELDELEEVGSG